jgi:hypothetical protein
LFFDPYPKTIEEASKAATALWLGSSLTWQRWESYTRSWRCVGRDAVSEPPSPRMF